MSNVNKSQELVVKLGNNIGAGATLFGALQRAGVNVVASTCIQIGEEVKFSIVPDDVQRAAEVLERSGLTVTPKPVLLVEMPNTPGALAELLGKIAALGVNVRSAYATTSVKELAKAVLMTDDDERVVKGLGGG